MAGSPVTLIFALFKNGVEVANTRFEVSDPVINLGLANSAVTYTAYTELYGSATISLVAGDAIELRNVSSLNSVLQGTDTTKVVAALNIEKVSV